MLKILPYEGHVSSIFKELDQEISWTAVTPSPLKSDIFREIAISSKYSQVKSITISKFIKDILGTDGDLRKSKSELLMELWTIWKIKANENYNSFRYVFDLFTEIRSYSLEIGVIEELKDFITEDVFDGLILFYHYFESSNIIDEQKSYALAGSQYSGTEKSGYVFWGFDHLNAIQIDMIKALTSSSFVVIPLPKKVLSEIDTFDWPYWLSTEEYADVTLHAKLQIKAFQVPVGRLTEYLDKILKKDEKISFIDFNKASGLNELSSFQRESVELKTNVDIFSINLNSIYSKLQDQFDWSKEQSVESILNWSKEERKAYFDVENMRSFKILFMFDSLLDRFQNYSDKNESLKWSDLLILKEVLQLDLPRTSMVSLIKECEMKVLDRDSLGTLEEGYSKYLFIDKNADKSLRENSNYSADVLSVLSAYGPRQNKKFEALMISSDLFQFANDGGIIIFEDGAFEDSYEWEQVLESIDLEISKIKNDLKIQAPIIPVENEDFKGLLSATKIQSYIDCPRKFAYEYKNRVNLLVRGRTQITPDIKGLVEHLLIEKFLDQNNMYDELTHKTLGQTLLKNEIKSNGLIISRINFDSALEEIIAYTAEIIQRLLSVKNSFGVKFIFEYDLNTIDPLVSGRVDLILELDGKYLAIDFKRSSTGVPSKKDFEEFNKIQMWFYSQRLSQLEGKIIGVGYLSLADLSESRIYMIDDCVWSDLLFGGMKTSVFKDSFQEKLQAYAEFETEVVQKMNTDVEFLAMPKSNGACDYCVANPVCTRGAGIR